MIFKFNQINIHHGVITKYECVDWSLKYVFDTNTSYKNSQGTIIMALYCKLLSGNDNVI